MKKTSLSFYKINTLVLLALSIIVSSCNGQKTRSDVQNTMPLGQKLSQNATLAYSQKKEQISQVVRKVFQDSRGDIWFGAEGGAYRLSNDSLIRIDRIRSESGKGVTIKDIVEDNHGKIWMGHTDGISCVDGEEITNYYESDGLLSNDVWCLESDKNNQIWIGTINGVCIFNGQVFRSFELPEGKVDTTLGISSTKMIHSIMEDSQGDIWFCSNAGLFNFNNNKLTNISEKVGIRTHFMNEIMEDRDGLFWISTKEALYKLKGNQIENITCEILTIGKGAGCVEEDKDGNIWFVFDQHDLYTYDGENIVELRKSGNNNRPVVFQIFKDQQDRLWFVGFGGVFRFENGKFISITKDGPW